LAALIGRTKSLHAREAIVEHIGDLEDIYLAEQRRIDLRRADKRSVIRLQ
jgi:RHH-type rel operon transcriptional repressor/antitoxin RelB